MRKFTFECDDSYEAEKLASMATLQKDGSFWISGVAAIVGKEIVLQLKDRSSHSIVMKNDSEAKSLRALLLEIVDGRLTVTASESTGMNADITVS